MNKKGYAVTCCKCDSINIKYDYRKTTLNIRDNKASTPIKCLDCGYETFEEMENTCVVIDGSLV